MEERRTEAQGAKLCHTSEICQVSYDTQINVTQLPSDVALLKLDLPFEISSTVKPIKLVGAGQNPNEGTNST